MNPESKKRNPWIRAARIAAKTVLFILLFFLIILLLLQTGPVQNALKNKVVAYLQKKLKTKVEISRVHVTWPKDILLENVYLEDRQKDTLLAGGNIKANIDIMRLLFRNEVNIHSIALENITAKVKRILPDTVFNFQFVVDAFASKDTTKIVTPDTSYYSIAIPSVTLDKTRVIYKDTILGVDMEAWLDHLDTQIDSLDYERLHFDVPKINIKGLTARIYQNKPLVKPDPEIKDLREAKQPNPLKLAFKEANLEDVKIDFRNDVSAMYTTIDLDKLNVQSNAIDLDKRLIDLKNISLANTTSIIRLGRKEQAKIVEKEVKQEAKSQVEAGWQIRVASLDLNNNTLQFDNDNSPKTGYGIDYGHMKGEAFTLSVEDLVLSLDSIGGKIKNGSFKEQSGFVLNELQTDFLYAHNQTYLKDLILKTPGTELKRYALLRYNSFKDLADNFPGTQIDADIDNSHIQVKDILAFAPQLRSQPAFANPNAIWYLNFQGSGTIESMHVANLQFRGLKNTQIDASGSVAAANNDPGRSGGTLYIRRLHTTQSDIALLTGQRLSNEQIDLPEEFDAHGSVAGSVNNLTTNLTVSSSVGAVSVNGRFTDLMNPAAATYAAAIRTNSLNLGHIIRNNQVGNVSANVTVSGKGFTPNNMNTAFKGDIYALAYNSYVYKNINVNGTLKGSSLNVTTNVNDPNIHLNGTLTSTLSANPSFHFEGMIDSVNAMPLGFTTQPLVARGKIVADVPVMNANYLEANVLLTKALFVSASQRLPLDTVQFISGRNDTAQFMTLKSDVANASLSGQYRYSDLGMIIQNSIQPYFSVSSGNKMSNVAPYNFSFTADVANAPVLAAFVPGLKSFEPIHIDGRAATNQGITATMTTPFISYNRNDITGLNLKVNTTDRGLQFLADVQHIQGFGHNLYHTQLNAIANNNKVDFNLNIDDKAGKDKYNLAGLLTQSQGNYTLNLKPDSLLLNYDRWSISPNNSLTITKDNIIANNFTIQNAQQRLSLQSQGQLLNVGFTNFQLSTITGFLKSDSLMLNGSMNGTVAFRNILKQPVFTSDLAINDLSMKGDTIGNAVIKVDNSSGDRYTTNATITGRGNDIALTGSFAPQGEKDIALDLNLAIKQMQLATMEGAFAGMIKNASGAVNGNISIKGTASQPKIDGPLNFDKASFALTMLGSQYKIDGEKINVTENGFHFDDFVIRDTANNQLRLNGVVSTSNFINYNFNFDINANNFQVLNTTKRDNKIYYGKLVTSSNLHVEGTEVKPKVDGSITINDGTELSIVIPQEEPGVVERKGIVEFVDMSMPGIDSLLLSYDSTFNTTPFKGMDVTTNIEIKKEAVFNIIIDAANGDFISLQGEAILSTGIDPSGKITLVGNYELDRGAYEITFNFLHRRFEIQKGSRITWLNEPTKATLDVNAVYVANTSPIDLVQTQIAGSTQEIRNTYLQKLPFEVHLKMTGELMQPILAFDIVLPENKNYGVSNDIITQVDNRLEELRQDPGETNRQVFALLLLNRFVGQNPLASNSPMFSASAYARESVSKLLTEQLNKLAAGLIDGVDLTFDVTSTDDYTTGEQRSRTDLNIGLSKRLLNERLTVTVGSNVELEGPRSGNQGASNVIGNLNVNYAISKDGRYMIRFYRKNEYEGVVDGYIIETGLSFVISVDYNRFADLFRRKKKQRVAGVNYSNNSR